MVSVLVKSFGGAPPALVFPRHRRVPGREVAQQGPGTTVQSASLQRAVQVLALIEVAVHASHQSVKHVARAVAAGVAVGNRPAVTLATQVQDLLQDDPCEVSGRPLAERAKALCKIPAVGRVIGIPNPPGDFGKHLFKVFSRSGSSSQPCKKHSRMTTFVNSIFQAAFMPFPAIGAGTISRHIICSGQLFAQFFRGHPEELPEAQRGQLQAQQAVRRLILSVPGPELV